MSSRERIQKALDALLYLPHLQAQHSDDQLLPAAAAPAAGTDAAGRGRPWDRGDLFRRLATFRSGTWFCKPAAIGPVECARRGWSNTAADLLTCEFCKAKVSCPIPADSLPEQAQQAAQRYAVGLTEAHDAACPWRTASSSPSLLQFPPLTAGAVRRDFDARCAALQRLACLPPAATEACEALAAASGGCGLDRLLLAGPGAPPAGQAPAGGDAAASLAQGVASLGSPQFQARARLLALCGWDLRLMTAAVPPPPPPPAAQPSEGAALQQAAQQSTQELPSLVGPESAVLQCGLCAARAGLWTFFPGCKPVVLAGPRRRGPSGQQTLSAAVIRATVSRNVAADIGTTIAGGAMQATAAAAPFGAQQPAAPGTGAAAPPPAAPFGGGARAGGPPVFGFAALQAPKPAVAGQAAPKAAASAGQKRKEPDFSWAAVMADIDAKSAADKRSRDGTAAAGGAGGAAAAVAAAASAASAAGARLGGQQQVAAAAALAGKYRGAAVAPLDPLLLHRPFCPWVNGTQAGEKEGRCGWRWCLQQLAAPAAAASAGADDRAAAEGGDGGSDGAGKAWDPAKLLRNVLQQVDVHK